MPMIPETPQEKVGSNLDIQRQEDSNPIQVGGEDCTDDERKAKEEKIVEKMAGMFDDWEKFRKPFEDLWNEIYKLLFGRMEHPKTYTRAKINIPVVFQAVEAVLPKLLTVIFGSDNLFNVEPINKKKNAEAKVIELLLNHQLQQANFFVKFVDFAKQLCLYGTSYFFVYWKVTRRWVWTRTPKRRRFNIMGVQMGDVVEWEEKKEYKVVERRPEIDVVDILDVFPDPEGTSESVDDSKGFFIQSWMDVEDIRALGHAKYPVYGNVDDTQLEGQDQQYGKSRSVRRSVHGTADAILSRKDQVWILSYWGSYDLDDDGIKEEVEIVLGNKKVLLKARANPFHHQKRPLIRATLFPVPLEWFGLGLVEPVISLIHEMTTLRRQRLDNINMAINRMWKVLDYSTIDLDSLVSTPNGIILVDQMDAIEALETTNVTNQAYTEAASVKADIDGATAPQSMQGNPQSGSLGRTAKGAQMIIAQALEKFGTAAKLLEESGVKKVLRMMLQLNLQFIDQDDQLREGPMYGSILDEKVTPEMLREDVEFEVFGISDITQKESHINQIISFMGVFGKVLHPKTIEKLAKKIWDLMGFDEDEIQIMVAPQMPPGGGGQPPAGQPQPGGQPPNPQQKILAQLKNGQGNPPNVRP